MEKRALSWQEFLDSGFDGRDYNFPDFEGTFEAEMVCKRWDKNSKLLVYLDFDDGRKIITSAWQDSNYKGLADVPFNTRVRVTFQYSKKGISYVSLPVSLFGKGDFYILRAKGDSMVDAGIAEGDLLVIERNCPASEGDIVVALDQEQQNTLKRYVGFDNDEKCFILAYENEARYPGEVIKLKSFEVQGVARHVIKAL